MTGPMRDASEVIAGWSEHDRKIMADIEAMAANRHNGFWPSAIAQSALRIIHREATPQPASADVVDARRYRWLRSGPDQFCGKPCVYRFQKGDQEYPTPIGNEALDAAIDAAMTNTGPEG